MKLRTLSLYADFLNFLRRQTTICQKHVKIGDLPLTFRLVNTAHLSAESKLTYAYLFFHRRDVTGFKIAVLSEELGMTPKQIRNTLKELQTLGHIKLITTQQAADLSELTYYYEIVDPSRYGMLGVEKHYSEPQQVALSTISE